jgi:hypothetical protein
MGLLLLPVYPVMAGPVPAAGTPVVDRIAVSEKMPRLPFLFIPNGIQAPGAEGNPVSSMPAQTVSFAAGSIGGVLPDYNNIFVRVANDGGVKYDAFGNDTYNIRFEGIDRGLNALHISTDPATNFGQVTTTGQMAGSFYATDSGGKGYEDEILLMVAANGTVPEDFSLRITADGYSWTPNPVSNMAPDPDTVTYQPVALDETFTKADLIYGPQIWKPTGNEDVYPIYYGQDMADTENTFRLMFVDLNAGVLRPNTSLRNQGAVRINYTIQNPGPLTAFSVYGYCRDSNNGDDMVAWSNALVEPKALSGYSVERQPAAPAVTSILPKSGRRGTTVSITNLTGTGFSGTGARVQITKSGQTAIAATNVVVNGDRTKITCRLPIGATRAIGLWNVKVINADGQTGTRAGAFMVRSATAPVVTGILTPYGRRGTTVTVTNLSGTGFVAPDKPMVQLTKAGQSPINATNVVVVSPLRISCRFAIPATSAIGLWNVNVINADGQSGMKARAFTVKSATAPTVKSIQPGSGKRGTTVMITNLSGTGFVAPDKPTVQLTKTGVPSINATNVVVLSPVKITCRFPVAPNTTTGPWNVRVINADGQSGTRANLFTVKA